jgi:hypothetical protein
MMNLLRRLPPALIAVLLGSLVTLAPTAGGAPSAPNTRITFGPAGWTNLTNPVFAYESDDPEARFECRLDAAAFEPCGPSEEEARGSGPGETLTEGRHTFEVRAVTETGLVDPTPARVSLVVDTHSPTVRILRGPSGTTHRRRPSFRLKVVEANSFSCTIWGKSATDRRVRIKVRSCDGRHFFRPPHPLADGRYVFILHASTRAGSEEIESREFRVVGRSRRDYRHAVKPSTRNGP